MRPTVETTDVPLAEIAAAKPAPSAAITTTPPVLPPPVRTRTWRKTMSWMLALAAAGALGFGFRANLSAPSMITVESVLKTAKAKALVYWHKLVPEPIAPVPAVARWAAVAPGRVEARTGEVRISAALQGRVAALVFKVGDRVEAGDPLILLDNEAALALARATEAESRSAKRLRDKVAAAKPRETDLRKAGDKVDTAQRKLWMRRAEFDRLVLSRRGGIATDKQVADARAGIDSASEDAAKALHELKDWNDSTTSPTLTALDAATAAAYARHATAEAQLEKARIRAPIAGTVLQIQTKLGETVIPSPDQVLIVLGDLQALRVRTEVSERDIARVKAGQAVTVKVDAYPDREFAGTVSTIAPALSPPKLGPRGPRKSLDIDVLEVHVDLDGAPPLLPGMRADVYFKLL